MAPDSNEIRLFAAHLDDAAEASLLDEYRSLMSADEREREQRYLHRDDRLRHLVACALMRTVLADCVQASPRDLRFSRSRHGKPALDADAGRGLRFNISHSGRLVVMAVARDMELGIDTECLHSRALRPQFAERYFSPRELEDIHALPDADRGIRLFEYWTLKEAYVKARGIGVSMNLDRFGFLIGDHDRIGLWMHPDFDDVPGRWQAWQLRAFGHFLIGLCAERTDPDVPARLELIRIVPLRGADVLDANLLRSSTGTARSRAV